MSSSTRAEYLARLNRVLDYIERHLDQPLSLTKIAEVANFSPFHFHRIFSALLGETPQQFIQRLRLEKASTQLLGNPKKSITEIALDCGFTSSAAFARSFREAFQLSPREWRAQTGNPESKLGKMHSKKEGSNSRCGKDFLRSSLYIDLQNNQLIWRIHMKNFDPVQVEVKDLPETPVAYLRHIGPYKGDAQLFERLFQKLMTWAAPRGLLRFPQTKCMCLYHDDPEITAAAKLRLDVAITVPPGTSGEGEFGVLTIPAGKYALARFEIASSTQYESAWKAVYGGWLPESGYQPDDRLCFELYHNDPKQHPEGKTIVDICIPVKPL